MYQAIFTWIIFDFAGVKYVYLYALIGALFRAVPFVSTSVIGLIGAFQLFFQQKSAIAGYEEYTVW